jgi:hypothetical protein
VLLCNEREIVKRVLLYTASGELVALRRPAGFCRALEAEPVAEGHGAVTGSLLEPSSRAWWDEFAEPPPGRHGPR